MAPPKQRPSRMSKHFHTAEFDCRDGTRVPPAALDGLHLLCEWWLEPLRARFGLTAVYSGFRTPAWNEHVGGAEHSFHLYELERSIPNHDGERALRPVAADVRPRAAEVEAIAAWCRVHRRQHPHLAGKGRGGIGVYVGQGFVHLDTGPLRDWRG